MLISIPDFVDLIEAGAFQVIANAAMHINDALKEEGNGEVSAALRERLKRFEVANTWIKDTAWGFSISYRKSQTIPGSAGYVIPAGAVCKISNLLRRKCLFFFTRLIRILRIGRLLHPVQSS